jgi:hypothetical protein
VTSGRSPWWRQRQRERFARAVDASPEADQASDPKLAGELAVVMMLRRSADATAPDKAARDRMRAALFEQLGAEEPAPPTPSPAPGKRPATASRPPGPSHSTRPGRRSSARGRLAIALGAAFCVVLALSGMTLLLSRHALPGDALYGVRRTVESATLGLTSGDNGKGLKHLEFAADRIGDIESLAQRYPDARDSPVGDYLTAFADFDADARAGTTDLTSYATNHGDGVLTTLGQWAAQQAARIARADPALPPAAHTQAVLSTQLLSRIVQRAKAVAARNDCFTITSGATDDLGVVPATGPCDLRRTAEPSPAVNGTSGSIRPTKPGQPGITGPTSAQRAPVQPQQTQTFTTPTEPPATGNPAGGGGSASTTTTKPGITIPLPLPSITIPPLLPGLPGVGIGQ